MIQRELTILWPTEGWRIAEVLARQDVINPLRQLYESLTRFTTLSASMRELPDLVFRSAAPPTTVSELIELLPVSSSAFYDHWHEEVSGTATPKELLDWVLLVRATWMVRRHRSNTFPPLGRSLRTLHRVSKRLLDHSWAWCVKHPEKVVEGLQVWTRRSGLEKKRSVRKIV